MTEKENKAADAITTALSGVIDLLGDPNMVFNRKMWLQCKSFLESASLRIGREVPRIDRPKGVETIKPQPLKKAEPVKAVSSDVLAYSQDNSNDPLPKPKRTKSDDSIHP
jgi:hypothetical protein